MPHILSKPSSKILLPTPEWQWREPSQSSQRRTMFRLRAYRTSGHLEWEKWYTDRQELDWALWDISIGGWTGLLYNFATISFLASPTGSNQTYTSPADWNNSSNQIETLGAGASGATLSGQPTNKGTGGGGGAYNTISNFTFATPGTTTATYQIGTAGISVVVLTGIAGGDTWFNGTTLAGSSVGSKGGGPGQWGNAAAQVVGGTGGVAASGVGSGFNGGRGGNTTATASNAATGGGGAAGKNGAGNQGVDGLGNTNGGSGDAGNGGAGGSDAVGGNGTEWSASYGSGGGGGGSSTTGRTGGTYGAGGGGKIGTNSGAGSSGLIVITYTPSGGGGFIYTFNHPMLGW